MHFELLQVYGVARQMLSLVAGGAIDEYILSQLKALRQEHQLARLIHSLQISLWPGGIWFQRTPGRQTPVSRPSPAGENALKLCCFPCSSTGFQTGATFHPAGKQYIPSSTLNHHAKSHGKA